jgi:hypothetical protein
LRLVSAGRRDWAEAIWAEASEVPSGLRRLAWLAGGARVMVREALMARRIGRWLLFAVTAAVATRGVTAHRAARSNSLTPGSGRAPRRDSLPPGSAA